jgi:benzoyl-CoA reductase/2-hydroxyglutaryl-CoA dehydratase subunit BcrC/BadD/HgdB
MRVKAITKNNCEGAVIHTNRSCKQWSGFMYELERGIREKTGIPTVTFDGDQADPRNFSEAQYDTRIQGLVEVMEANKNGGNL